MTYSNADFTPSLKGYSDIKPFRFWCQKVLPLVYDDSLSYYELLCKVTDYINNIITDLATTEENVGSLLDAYNQLQDYVNDYFTNLDVQEEINNHLDDLVADGTLTRLIGNYVQPYLDDFQEQMDTYEENLTQDIGNYKTEMNGNFASLQNSTSANLQQQNDKISVLEGRMDTFSQLTPGSTTGDAELQDIRVAYNGIVYPTAGDAVRDQVGNIVSDNYDTPTKDATNNFTSGMILLGNVGINNTVDTTPQSSANFLYQIIECKKGDTILLTGQGGEGPRLWGITDSAFKLLSVANVSIAVTDLTLQAQKDGYFIVNVNKNYTYSLTTTLSVPKVDLLTEDLNDLSDKVDVIDNNVIELYQNNTANKVKTSENLIPDDATIYTNSRCAGLTTSYVPSVVAGDAYLIDMAIPSTVKKIWCKKFTKTGQMVLIYKANTSGVNYTKSAAIDNTLIHNDSEYFVIDCSVALSRGFERIMISFDSVLTAGIYEYNGILNAEQNFDYLMPLSGLNMFGSIACLGDSYTQGFIVKSDQSATIAKKPYPAVLHDKLGIDVDNYGVGGTTSKTYLTHVDGMPKVLADEAHDLYIICFGINDQGQNMTIGSASDINDADYTQNADTFYGNMGKIVQMLKAQFPLARYTIIGNFATGLWYSAYNPYNVASKGIAEHFSIPYVNPMDDPYFYSDIYINDVGGHPTQPGYAGMAYAIERLMNKCIADNFEYFKYAGVESI